MPENVTYFRFVSGTGQQQSDFFAIFFHFTTNKLVPKKVRPYQLFWSSRSSEYEGTACAQIRSLSAQSPPDLTPPSGTPGAQAHAYDMQYK